MVRSIRRNRKFFASFVEERSRSGSFSPASQKRKSATRQSRQRVIQPLKAIRQFPVHCSQNLPPKGVPVLFRAVNQTLLGASGSTLKQRWRQLIETISTSKFVRLAVDWLLRSDIGEVINEIVHDKEHFPDYRMPKNPLSERGGRSNKNELNTRNVIETHEHKGDFKEW